tara:strand:+ start:19101 stop:19301 length:201 start_codon:yes stop_codon:yes gene_type:complete
MRISTDTHALLARIEANTALALNAIGQITKIGKPFDELEASIQARLVERNLTRINELIADTINNEK